MAPVSEHMLRLASRLFGIGEVVNRIVDPLTVSTAKAERLLGWVPPFDLNAGLARTVEWYVGSTGPRSEDRLSAARQ